MQAPAKHVLHTCALSVHSRTCACDHFGNQAQPAGHPCSHLLRHVCERIAQPTKVACRVLVRGDLTSLIMSYGVEFSRGAPMGICAWCLAISATSIPSAVDIASCGSSGGKCLRVPGRSPHRFVRFLGPSTIHKLGKGHGQQWLVDHRHPAPPLHRQDRRVEVPLPNPLRQSAPLLRLPGAPCVSCRPHGVSASQVQAEAIRASARWRRFGGNARVRSVQEPRGRPRRAR